jgi:hypothetical protein
MLDFIAAHPLVTYSIVAGAALVGFMFIDGRVKQ